MLIIVTGGAGFIGSNFLNLKVKRHPEHSFINVDKLTYAANLLNLQALEEQPNYRFIQLDIADFSQLNKLFADQVPDLVYHFAAESHVDRSIAGPAPFIYSNIIGTFNLLEVCRKYWQPEAKESLIPKETGEKSLYTINKKSTNERMFVHVSTDEVYGSLGPEGYFCETTAYDPSSPYSASKAASDHLVRAYHRTYGLPAVITNCSNNYGPFQFPEKLIPLMILNAIEYKPMPVYGRGENVRDWLYVSDHCNALWRVAECGKPGETYNIGGNCERRNIDIVNMICEILASELQSDPDHFKELITFVSDRPGHDLRYAIDADKIKTQLGWYPEESLESGLIKTVRWYLENQSWIESVQSGDYKNWINKNYGNR